MTINSVSKELVKVNGPVNYASEYLLKETLAEYRVRVRHTKTGGKNGLPVYDRHNFELVMTTYATDTVPEFYRKMYFVMEVLPSDDDITIGTAVADIAIASSGELFDELNDWQS
jgi:hypothetical protein